MHVRSRQTDVAQRWSFEFADVPGHSSVLVNPDIRRRVRKCPATLYSPVLWNSTSRGSRPSELVASLKLNPPWQRKQESCWLKNKISPRLAESDTALSSPP